MSRRSAHADRPDWLYGTGATGTDRALVHATAAVALVLLGAGLLLDVGGVRTDGAWTWWRLLLAAVLVVDLFGGIVANASDSAKRLYHGPLPPGSNRFERLVHGQVSFAALHVHPLAVGVLFPGGAPWWGPLWYAWALLGVAAVHRAPRRYARPLALGIVASGIAAATTFPAPTGWSWFPAVLLLKLVVAHAVDEVPAAARPAAVRRSGAGPAR